MNEPAADDRRIVQEIAGRFGPPAFMRRARLVESLWTQLLDKGRFERLRHLDMVGMRLAQLRDLAGDWDVLRTLLPDESAFDVIVRLYNELQPRLHLPLEATTSLWTLRGALDDLV